MTLGRIGQYLVREVAMAWLAVAAVLIVVLLTNRLIDFLTQAVTGDVPRDVVFTLLGLKAIGGIGKVLPASFFLGIMLGVGRLYRDSEMTAMTACGVGPWRLYGGLYVVAMPLAILVAALSLYIMPWAERTAEQTLVEARQQAQFQGVSPGRFVRMGDGNAVVYIGGIEDDGTMASVFARLSSPEGKRLVTAAGARRTVTETGGDEYLVLEDGQRYDLPGSGASGWRILDFSEHGVRLEQRAAVERQLKRDELPTRALWRTDNPKNRAELAWRLAMPVTTLVFAFIALPLSATGSRQGRYGKLLAAVLICALYLNLLKVGQEWLEAEAVPAIVSLWWVHLAFLIGGAVLVVRQYGLSRRVS